MAKRFVISAIAIILAMSAVVLRAQDEKWNSAQPAPSKDKTPAPAPRRDVSGIWYAQGGVGAKGVREHPDDPAHVGKDVPYTADGKAARAKNKPGEGEQQVPVAEVNDPVDTCEPQGYPRLELHALRAFELRQTENEVLLVDSFGQSWRKIWLDGRQLPKEVAPRWMGYSVGKWEDDYTLVVETVNIDDRSWIDNVGRPHSDALRVEERWHRIDHDNMELTMTIDDPKYYTQPWMALNKLRLRLMPDDFDMTETICSPSEVAAYNKEISAGHAKQ